MKMSARALSVIIVAIFIGSIMTSLTTGLNQKEQQELEDLAVVSEAPSPGHNVFLQYISSDNCYYCYTSGGGSESAHNLKMSNPDEFVYITYMSASYGSTNDARSGNVAPIYAMNHLGESGGAPTAYMGDSDPEISGSDGQGTRYNSAFSSGGSMASSVNDYQINVIQTVNPSNSANVDITMEASYIGSGTAPSSTVLYAAVTEENCAYTYSDGTYGHNCWRAWLLNGNSYATTSGTTGSGSGFVTMDLSRGIHSETWTVPASLARSKGGQSGINNMLSIGAIYSTWSTSSHNADVFAVSDSSMGPKMDLAISDVTLSNPASADGYVNGDQITVTATAKNIGGLDYTDGGTLEIVYLDAGNPIVVDTKSLSNLVSQATMSHTATVDTTSLPTNAWNTKFGARLSGLTGDGLSSNNLNVQTMEHDRPPLAKQATVSGNNVIERGSIFQVIAKGSANDNVDTIDSMTFELEVSPAGQNLWDGSVDSGGEVIVNAGTTNEGREYVITPTMEMTAGWYDLRSRTIDGRSQTSNWRITSNAFELANGIPMIVAEPVPPVVCDQVTSVDLTGHVSDPETVLSDLIIDSDHPSFISWNPSTTSIDVKFAFSDVQGCPLGQKSMLITVDDGGDYSSQGVLPSGTLKFNVIENGQPRWSGLPTQIVDEQGPQSDGTLRLLPFISDTDVNGQYSDPSLLTFSVVGNSNPELIEAQLIGNVLGFETKTDDSNGQSTITVKACDTDQECSEQTVLVQINPINDAPRVDMTDIDMLTLKAGTQMSIDLQSRVSDVDDTIDQVTTLISSSLPGSAQYIRSSGMLNLQFSEIGIHTVTVEVRDTYDVNIYTITVDVYDSIPFIISKTNTGTSSLIVTVTDLYISQTPHVMMELSDSAPTFTSMSVTWTLCGGGVCDGYWGYDLDVSKSASGWETDLNIPLLGGSDDEMARPNGYNENDYFTLSIDAVDSQNNNYKTQTPVKWDVIESIPAPSEMDEETLIKRISVLEDRIESLEQEISIATGDTSDLEVQLLNYQSEYDDACLDGRVQCTTDSTSSGGSSEDSTKSSNNLMIIGIVAGVIIVALLGGLFVMRGGRVEENINGFQWADTTLPARDAVANSMYGGTQQMFQQQVNYQQPVQSAAYAAAYHQPAPVPTQPTAPIIPSSGPPLPPSGLPTGWTMEQWNYYGQQYLDRMNNQ
ncbi:MAG: hypothetical protein DWB99_04420 [Candidatus Poseidoniales archaeon]|nr:MAG: hypothetical protein DWB99_04420 [Candidatus Poseidoniales archaeon]